LVSATKGREAWELAGERGPGPEPARPGATGARAGVDVPAAAALGDEGGGATVDDGPGVWATGWAGPPPEQPARTAEATTAVPMQTASAAPRRRRPALRARSPGPALPAFLDGGRSDAPLIALISLVPSKRISTGLALCQDQCPLN
jgi:hypothetical protein